jgi:hypothetical protein
LTWFAVKKLALVFCLLSVGVDLWELLALLPALEWVVLGWRQLLRYQQESDMVDAPVTI